MDDYEHQIFDGMVIFIDPTTGMDESPALSMKRFTFSNALSSSVPHHKHKLRTWVEGDCYQLIKLVCVQVRLTGRAQYNTIMAFGAITFRPPKTIDELISDLHVVKVKANRLRTHAIDDDTLKGALLTHCAGRQEYAQLARDFSRQDCTKSYADICDEFREQEYILLTQKAQTHRALHIEHKSRPRRQRHVDSDDEQTSRRT